MGSSSALAGWASAIWRAVSVIALRRRAPRIDGLINTERSVPSEPGACQPVVGLLVHYAISAPDLLHPRPATVGRRSLPRSRRCGGSTCVQVPCSGPDLLPVRRGQHPARGHPVLLVPGPSLTFEERGDSGAPARGDRVASPGSPTTTVGGPSGVRGADPVAVPRPLACSPPAASPDTDAVSTPAYTQSETDKRIKPPQEKVLDRLGFLLDG